MLMIIFVGSNSHQLCEQLHDIVHGKEIFIITLFVKQLIQVNTWDSLLGLYEPSQELLCSSKPLCLNSSLISNFVCIEISHFSHNIFVNLQSIICIHHLQNFTLHTKCFFLHV